jgi:hypothetical protein
MDRIISTPARVRTCGFALPAGIAGSSVATPSVR